jgi:hypothetical protein
MSRRVSFSLNKNSIYYTYSRHEYDRSCIDHVLYRHAYNRLTDEELKTIYVNLDLYKLYEMPIHKGSLVNNLYHVKKYQYFAI